MKRINLLTFLAFLLLGFLTQCDKNTKSDDEEEEEIQDDYSKIENTLGFGLLEKAVGIWNGPVSSTTPLGGFPEWIVDFRPISENQISSKNELDVANDIHMSFFIAKYNGEYRLCFRNGGMFAGNTRVSYFLADSATENSTKSYYRFSELVKGESRAFTEVHFEGDKMIIKSFTNKYNTLNNPALHMTWTATLQDRTSSEAAVSKFDFPQKTLTKDFSNDFDGINEAIFFSTGGNDGDPYPENQQPYLGEANISYSFSSAFNPSSSKKVLLMITTKPIFNGFSFDPDLLRFRSRYILLSATDLDFTFKSMHPGSYYLYALYDDDGNGTFSSGDGVSTNNVNFEVLESASVNASTQINFRIP